MDLRIGGRPKKPKRVKIAKKTINPIPIIFRRLLDILQIISIALLKANSIGLGIKRQQRL
jgi:hypothetical protein